MDILKKNTDMTSGPIGRLLIYFAVPLLIGNLFQQFYNTVVKFFNGVSIGASVVTAQYYGAGEKLHRTVGTIMTITIIFGVVFFVLGYYASPFMLHFMSTPDNVMESANQY